jgi:aryl-alcohol dehydrogenase-like predicted oxidoreductase
MKNNVLGNTGIEVSPITIGAWQLGGPLFFDGKPDGHPDPGKENVIRMIRELGDLGVNSIDTAEQYSAGESERRIAEAIGPNRDRWVISTKFGYRVGPGGTRIDDSSPATIMPSLEGSLQRLKSDRIDIYLYHCAPELNDLNEGRSVLEKAKAEGKIRSYGISTADLELIQAMTDKDMIDVLQYPASMLDPRDDIRELCVANKIGTQLRGVMAQGRLSGKYFKKTPAWAADDNRSSWCADEDYTRFAPLGELVPESYTMAETAIRWMLDQLGVHTICMGAKNLDDYKAAIHAASLPPFSEETRAALAELAGKL